WLPVLRIPQERDQIIHEVHLDLCHSSSANERATDAVGREPWWPHGGVHSLGCEGTTPRRFIWQSQRTVEQSRAVRRTQTTNATRGKPDQRSQCPVKVL